jgi:hypothetical protein
MGKRIALYIALFFLPGHYLKTFSQVRISGPECITPGIEYQYDLYSLTNKVDSINLCIDGGYLTADKKSCYNGKTINSIRITWNENIAKGQISVSTSRGNVSFRVRQTKPLQGGKIDSLSRMQALRLSGKPGIINCTSGRGGSCSPAYEYQWEQSGDNLHWTQIKGAIAQNLSFAAALAHTVFVRRRIIERSSDTIAYSDVAVIVVTN